MASLGNVSIWSNPFAYFFHSTPVTRTQADDARDALVKKYDETTPEQLKVSLTQAIQGCYARVKQSQAAQTNEFLETLLTYLQQKDDLWAEGVTKTLAQTLVKQLYNEDVEDTQVLDALIHCNLPLNPNEKEKAQSWLGFAWYYIDALINKEFYNGLPQYLKVIIDKYEQRANKHSLALHTGKPSVENLKTLLAEDVCESYLNEVLTAILDNEHELQLDKNRILENIRFAVQESHFENLGTDFVEKVIGAVAPMIADRFTILLTKLFNEKYSYTDVAVRVLDEHLNGLHDAKIAGKEAKKLEKKAKYPATFNQKALTNLFKKPTLDRLDEGQVVMAKVVYGKNYQQLNNSERKSAEDKFIKKYKFDFLEYVSIAKQPRTHDSLKGRKVVSREMGELLYKMADAFLDDNFLMSMVKELNTKVPETKKILTDEAQIRKLLPFVKFVLRVYLIQLIEKEYYEKYIEPEFEEATLRKRLNELVLPSLKETLYLDLVQRVISHNIHLLQTPTRIAEEVLKVLGKNPKSQDKELESVVDATLARYNEFKAQANIKDPQKCFEKFIEYTPPKGENIASYSNVANTLFFDYGGLPGWLTGILKALKWFISFFWDVNKAVSTSLTSLLHNYRRTPNYIAKMIDRRAQQSLPQTTASSPALNNRVTTQPFQSTTIEEISKIIYVSSTYKTSYARQFVLWCALGSEGKRITTLFNNVLNNTLYKGSNFNKSLAMNLLEELEKKVVTGVRV